MRHEQEKRRAGQELARNESRLIAGLASMVGLWQSSARWSSKSVWALDYGSCGDVEAKSLARVETRSRHWQTGQLVKSAA